MFSRRFRTMSENSPPYNLTVAGYLLLQQADEAWRSSQYVRDQYWREFGAYFGVDRLPLLITANPVIRELIGEPPVQNPLLGTQIDEWLDSGFGITAFIPKRNQALRLLKGFQELELRFELVYCQLAWKKGEEESLSAYATTGEAPPAFSLTYGFDVSWPNCKHSAIFQQGTAPASLPWRKKLNEYGLLNNYEDATRLRDEFLAIYPHPPFDIYLVHKVDQEGTGQP
jgi:hypothetical protein